jgi:hypothetical protein
MVAINPLTAPLASHHTATATITSRSPLIFTDTTGEADFGVHKKAIEIVDEELLMQKAQTLQF